MILEGAFLVALPLAWEVWAMRRRMGVLSLLRERHHETWIELGRPTWWRPGKLGLSPSANGRQLGHLGDDELIQCYKDCVADIQKKWETMLMATLLSLISLVVIASLLFLVP